MFIFISMYSDININFNILFDSLQFAMHDNASPQSDTMSCLQQTECSMVSFVTFVVNT